MCSAKLLNRELTRLNSTHGVWHEAYDCQLRTDVLFQIIPHLLPGDNPQQSETSSHIGVKGNHNSRRDTVGGTEKEKEGDEVYLKLYEAGVSRLNPL